MISGGQDSRRGINITRTYLNVTLYVHCLLVITNYRELTHMKLRYPPLVNAHTKPVNRYKNSKQRTHKHVMKLQRLLATDAASYCRLFLCANKKAESFGSYIAYFSRKPACTLAEVHFCSGLCASRPIILIYTK